MAVSVWSGRSLQTNLLLSTDFRFKGDRLVKLTLVPNQPQVFVLPLT